MFPQSPLQIAAATNQYLILQDLMAHGAQVNTRDCWGRAPLHVCAEKGHYLTLGVRNHYQYLPTYICIYILNAD